MGYAGEDSAYDSARQPPATADMGGPPPMPTTPSPQRGLFNRDTTPPQYEPPADTRPIQGPQVPDGPWTAFTKRVDAGRDAGTIAPGTPLPSTPVSRGLFDR